MPSGRLLEVERMAGRLAVYAAHARHARQIAQLVDHRRIHHQHQAAEFVVERLRHLHAQHGRVVQPAFGFPRILNQKIVNLIYAADDGTASAAPADNRIHAAQIDIPVL